MKFHENPSGGSRVDPRGRTDGQLRVAFRNFVNTSENHRKIGALNKDNNNNCNYNSNTPKRF
jgi:hypothetical protein